MEGAGIGIIGVAVTRVSSRRSIARLLRSSVSAASVLIIAISAGVSTVSAEAPAAPITKPKVVLDSTAFDWGTVNQGAKIAHDFVLKNGGDAELIIQRIVPSCGCTAVSTVADHIPVGGQTNIHVEVDTTGFAGAKEKNIRLFTNDPENPYATMLLRGTVEPDVTVEPQRVVFPDLIRGEISQPPTIDFSVRVRPGSAVVLKEITTNSKFISVKELSPGEKERKIQVILNPLVPNGELRDRVVIALAGGPVSAMNVPVIASIRGELQLKPATLSFGVIEGEQVLTKHVRLENSGQRSVNIKRISSDSGAVVTQFKVVKPGKIFDIQVDVDPRKVVRDLRAAVTIETEGTTEAGGAAEAGSESDGSLTLAVYGILPPK